MKKMQERIDLLEAEKRAQKPIKENLDDEGSPIEDS